MNDVLIEKKGVFCLVSNLIMFLNYHGIEITECEMCMLLGVYGFYFTREIRHQRDFINGRNGCFKHIFERFQLLFREKLKEEKVLLEKEAVCIKLLEKKLHNISSVVVKVNDYYLEHSNYYKSENYTSYVVLIKIFNNAVKFYDNGVRELPIQEFMKAINFDKMAYIYYTEEKKPKISYQEDASQAIKNGFEQFWKNMYCVVDDFESNFYGFQGMKKLSQEFEYMHDSSYWYNVFFCLNNPSGMFETRCLLSQYVKIIYDTKHEESILMCSNRYKEISEQWRVLANLFFKLSRIYSDELALRISRRIEQLINSEKECLQELRTILYKF